jgi:hypothetical protein
MSRVLTVHRIARTVVFAPIWNSAPPQRDYRRGILDRHHKLGLDDADWSKLPVVGRALKRSTSTSGHPIAFERLASDLG